MYYVYVFYTKSFDKFYIGYTDNLKQRVTEHKRGKVYTTYRMKDFELVYYEACLSKKDAQIRERRLKTGFGRGYLRKRLQDSLDMVA